MAWNDTTEIRVFASGQVYVAPVGTTLPVNPTASLNAAFVGLGYITEDGAALSVAPEIQDVMAWQSRQAVRRELVSQEVTATFALLQWNETNIVFAFGGGSVTTPAGGIYRYELPTDGALDERCVILEAIDGAVHERIILPRCNVTDAVETNFVRNDASTLPISVKALQPADGSTSMIFLTDDATSFAVGS